MDKLENPYRNYANEFALTWTKKYGLNNVTILVTYDRLTDSFLIELLNIQVPYRKAFKKFKDFIFELENDAITNTMVIESYSWEINPRKYIAMIFSGDIPIDNDVECTVVNIADKDYRLFWNLATPNLIYFGEFNGVIRPGYTTGISSELHEKLSDSLLSTPNHFGETLYKLGNYQIFDMSI